MKKFFLVILFAVALFAFQSKVVMPVVYDIVASDLFLEDTGDEKNDLSSSNIMTMGAFDQCNNYIANELLSDHTLIFQETFVNAFGLGAHQYVLNADVEIQPSDAPVFTRRYVCKIKYSEGNDTSGINISDNWSIIGISGLDDI
ncbi:MAG: hypothetical protein HFP81_07685 [Methylococcales symbiont of Hymedesmia sp. n. MRB-2018]|nr:MAG: hypothetical protein HFP78_07860 [Methylococcales symbiont of Hymedesmia sp. n. MRB-2018]KAF3983398.1 MAG: hypothetical protein HFP81_07685 [Methylococcales symbiont of Hymedesmia sp. n. MRB-2018]